MIKLIIIGNTNNCDIAKALVQSQSIDIIGGIVEYSSEKTATVQKLFLKENNITEISFDDISRLKPDLCLILTYTKIIPTQFFKDVLCLNIHAGILPKWRGFNANAWAIINGETKVGYTLHEATDEFDGGDIYYRFIESVSSNEKYGEVVPRIRTQICSKLPDILADIIKGKIKPESQVNKKYLCCMKLRKNDGLIKNWNIPSQYIYNLYRIMGTPYGTGIFFKFKNNIYQIIEMNLVPESDDYYGIAGAIVNITENKMWVKTSDNIIEINRITKDGIPVSITDEFKIGNRLAYAENIAMPIIGGGKPSRRAA